MSAAIVDLAREAPPRELSVEVCIIGSGCGGATAAWTLANAGKEVLVLEEGGDYTGLALTQRDGAMYDRLYMERGGRATSDLSIAVLQGRVLGGGGVINACDVVPLTDPLLRHWQTRYGLTDFSPEQLATYRARALTDLSANLPREDEINANNDLLRRGAGQLGWRGEIMLHNRVGCAGTGTCLIGCPLNVKKNPRFVAIPAAVEAGARFLLRARAVRIEGGSGELKTLHVRALDAGGHHEQASFIVRAKVVVLAANAIASAELLLRSGLGNEHVGRHLSLQPQLPVSALFDREVRFFRGIPQAFAVTEHERIDEESGLGGFRIESIGGTPGIVASMLPTLGHEGKAVMARYPNLAAVLCLVPDGSNGRVRLEPSGRMRIDYATPDEQKQRYRSAATAAARLFFAAGAREVHVATTPPIILRSAADLSAIEAIGFAPATVPLISAHQQGSVRFAPSPRDGAADPNGLVYGTRDVYVFDSSGFPTTSSSHTMAPILTISRYLADKLVARMG
jgi:choline dehydrogenase-like flavoprotein